MIQAAWQQQAPLGQPAITKADIAAGTERLRSIVPVGAFGQASHIADLVDPVRDVAASGPWARDITADIDGESPVLNGNADTSPTNGNHRDRSIHRLINILSRTPVFPVFGPVSALMQPIRIADLADGIVAAIHGRVRGPFNLAGLKPMGYNDTLKKVCSTLGSRVRVILFYDWIRAASVNVFQRIPKLLMEHEQVMRLQTEKALDIARTQTELGYSVSPFRDEIRAEAASVAPQDR